MLGVEAAGIEPADLGDERLHNVAIFPTKPQQSNAFGETTHLADEHYQTISEHRNDSFLHKKCVICVSHISEDLALVLRTWDSLPTAVQAGIVAMVKAARPQSS
jgi:hypothetical protein